VKVKHLAIGTGALAALAIAALLAQQLGGGLGGNGRAGRPALEGVDLSQAARVELQGPRGKVTLVAAPQGWVVEEQSGFPADQGKLTSFLLKLAAEKLAHRVTDNPAELPGLGVLSEAENGNKWEERKTGVLLSVRDSAGKPIYQLIIGNDRQAGEVASATGGQYVRYPGEKEAYLIGAALFAETEPKEWILRQVLPPDSNREFKRIRVLKAGARKALVFSRDQADSPWRLDDATVRGLNTKEIENLAKRISDLEAVQVAPASSDPAALGRAKTAQVEVTLFDGRTYRLDIGEAKAADGNRYVSVRAAAPEGAGEAIKKPVEEFNGRFHNRELGVYDWDAARLLKDRKEYLETAAKNAN
jgi:hypothetical protein